MRSRRAFLEVTMIEPRARPSASRTWALFTVGHGKAWPACSPGAGEQPWGAWSAPAPSPVPPEGPPGLSLPPTPPEGPSRPPTHLASRWAPPRSHRARHGPASPALVPVACGEERAGLGSLSSPGLWSWGGHPDPPQPSPLVFAAAVIVTALLLLSFAGIGGRGCCRAGLGWSLLLGHLLLLLLPFVCCSVCERSHWVRQSPGRPCHRLLQRSCSLTLH